MGKFQMSTEEVKLSGNLVRLFAIGGETTGYGLESTIELDLKTNNLEDKFSEDANVSVVGSFKLVEGVETGKRYVFVVSELKAIG